MAQNNQPIISIDHVSMRFNLAKEKHESLKEYFVALLHGGVRFDEFFALSDVSFDIMPGDFYGLIGLNGSGKSTLLKTIAGVYKPSKGKVTVNGTIAPLIELGAGFDLDLTARENIYLNGTVLGYTPKYIDSKFDDIVEFSELQEFLDVPLKNYSSGMVARIGFAIATITKPDILIADEVLSVGDFLFQQKCEKRMKACRGAIFRARPGWLPGGSKRQEHRRTGGASQRCLPLLLHFGYAPSTLC